MGIFVFSLFCALQKKCFSEPNINTSPLVEKGAKGKIKYFEKNHCTRLLLIPHTKYRPAQHHTERGYFTHPYQQVLLG
jgi:hypothetical protein